MKHLNLLPLILLAACATKITMTGKQYPAVDPLEVKILFKEKPACEYQELGFIATPLSWDQNAAIDKARNKAASIGADYINVNSVHVNVYNDASVSAIAYKCAKVDRALVKTSPEKD